MTALDLAACRRGELAERLVPKALELAGLVHGDGDALEIGRFLRSLPADELGALPVILAGLVPVDRPQSELLAYVTWDEYGRPLPAPVAGDSVPAGTSGPAVRFPCGTNAAYRRHENRGELVDDECAEAARVYYRARYQRRKRAGRAKEAATRRASRAA